MEIKVSLESTWVSKEVTNYLSTQFGIPVSNWKQVSNLHSRAMFYHSPIINTQTCIKGLSVVRNFNFWDVWAARPVHKKKLDADCEQLLMVFFSCFRGKKNQFYFKNTSVLTEKLHDNFEDKKIDFFFVYKFFLE